MKVKQHVAANKTTHKKIVLATSFDNQNEDSLFARIMRYTQKKGFDKPQDVVRLSVSKFLDREGF